MSKKEIFIKLGIILLIFFIGFFFRLESVNINSVPAYEKDYYQDQNGLPYMYELDSYYNYRLTKNYLDHGFLGDLIINGTEWDLHSYYPGVPMDYPPLIVYLTAFIYKLINLFAQIPLLTVSFWLPAFIAPISGIVAYFLVSRLTNNYGGLVAGILAVTAPFYFMRSIPGWFDTDMFNIIFPILVTWFLIEAILSKKSKIQFIFAFLAAFSMFLFSIAWNGWQYLFYILVFLCLFNIIWSRFKGRDIKKLSYISGIFIMGTILLIIVFSGFFNILKMLNILEFTKMLGNQSSWSYWPNSYIAVSELRVPTLDEILDGLGITILVLGAFSFFVNAILLFKKNNNDHKSKMNWFIYLIILFWFISSLLALFKGIRFIILLLPPLIISIGIMVGISTEYINKYLNSQKEYLIKFTCIILIIIVIFPAIINLNEYIYSTPGLNDDMWNSAGWIYNNTNNKTVVITEWSYGHLFTSIAERPVLYDGRMGYIETLPVRQFGNSYPFGEKSPSTSREYWIDKAFSTDNETLSLGIFRMLSTSGDLGYLTLDNYINNTHISAEALNRILGVDKPTAKEILINNYHLKENEALNVLKYTHPDNPNDFVIVTSNEMIRLGHWIFDFGEWDFNQKKARNHTYSVGEISFNETNLKTTNNVSMNLQNKEVKWNGELPYSYTIIKNHSIAKYYLDKKSSFSIFLILDEKKAVIMDKKFENSIFTKLVIERSNSTIYKIIYRNKKVDVWKSDR